MAIVQEEIDKQQVQLELQRIADAHEGTLDPTHVVEAAAPPEAPLHRYFEWDDTEAARQHRLNQARHLIRTVKIRFVTDEQEVGRVRAWHARRNVGLAGSGYVSESEVRQDPEMQQAVLRRMRLEWAQFKRRYSDHSEFWAMVAEDVPQRDSA